MCGPRRPTLGVHRSFCRRAQPFYIGELVRAIVDSFTRDSCYSAVTDDKPARRILPIELSSVVTSVVTITRELTKKLSHDEATEVVSELCQQLRTITG